MLKFAGNNTPDIHIKIIFRLSSILPGVAPIWHGKTTTISRHSWSLKPLPGCSKSLLTSGFKGEDSGSIASREQGAAGGADTLGAAGSPKGKGCNATRGSMETWETKFKVASTSRNRHTTMQPMQPNISGFQTPNRGCPQFHKKCKWCRLLVFGHGYSCQFK